MQSVRTATQIILDHPGDFGEEKCPLEQASGRVLAEPLIADRDFPPFDRVTMDGIAIQYAAFASGQRKFIVQGLQPAGAPPMQLQPGHCLEIMTGAVLPLGADTIIRYEDVHIANGVAVVQTDAVQAGQNIHRRGSDCLIGTSIVLPGKKITAAEISIAATIGKSELLVKKLPRVVIISTGDEIVPIDAQPLPHQIRSSNPFALQALLQWWGVVATKRHIPDDQAATIATIEACLNEFDVLILSGGVSAGKLDFVPEALENQGVQKLFHKVRQRPGKPFWFGRSAAGAAVFALPGNPVSAFMCAVRYFEPWLSQSLGLPTGVLPRAVLAEEVIFKPDLTYFLLVQLQLGEDGVVYARPLPGGGSGDLASLVPADAFLELPAGQDVYEKGSIHQYWQYRW